MAGLSSTLAQLAKFRTMAGLGLPVQAGDRLGTLSSFGTNPGALGARTYVPENLPAGRPLVVVLHGCTQSASGYDHGAGWSQLADEHAFALLLPEQQRANNPNLCFNWFTPADARRDAGEALSIRQMIAAMADAHHIDRDRIFVTGLSAGGAMASIMLATYPEVFAGGAIIAGLPFGCADSVSDALARMRGHGYPDDADLSDRVARASSHQGRWPRIAVWQGSADTTVAPSNAERIIAQWRGVHGLTATAPLCDTLDGCRRRTWHDAAGQPVIEALDVAGMGHGTPLRTSGPQACGTSGPYMIEAGISSTRQIARFWGVDDQPRAKPPASQTETRSPAIDRPSQADAAPPPAGDTRVGTIIETALRNAGLMR
ncbi:extracellular catalytic domain type 1 short-chain-length polyhydroxyalkanoate depolymerase [Sphingobium boeckii]|uniref:Poly(Hydroxyalkanoate) depolymerase family esterase n=1 Tax=Sphingobium boeckii TaxID=1082345 RepID=A0A7W9AKI4_9SPHN|nr:PHB depolymerase family esterase [Sphingobium boeckii]MBB5687099.1 poly(hydroxyalkanoate) depolymerase family esterase [Sphingobium boeckii]